MTPQEKMEAFETHARGLVEALYQAQKHAEALKLLMRKDENGSQVLFELDTGFQLPKLDSPALEKADGYLCLELRAMLELLKEEAEASAPLYGGHFGRPQTASQLS